MKTQIWSYRFPVSTCCELDSVSSVVESRSVGVDESLGEDAITLYDGTAPGSLEWGEVGIIVPDPDNPGDFMVSVSGGGTPVAIHEEHEGINGAGLRRKSEYRWKYTPLGVPWEARDGAGFVAKWREVTSSREWSEPDLAYGDPTFSYEDREETIPMGTGDTEATGGTFALNADEGEQMELVSAERPMRFTVEAEYSEDAGATWLPAGSHEWNVGSGALTIGLGHVLQGFYAEKRGDYTRTLKLLVSMHEDPWGAVTWTEITRPAAGGSSTASGSVTVTGAGAEEVVIDAPGADGRVYASGFETTAVMGTFLPWLVAVQECIEPG